MSSPVDGPFEHGEDGLRAGSVALSKVAARFGTPCYVYVRSAIEQRFRAYQQALGSPADVCFAVKANGNLAILQLLARLGGGFDIVSGGELSRVCRAGGDPARIVFSGVGKTAAELRDALQAGIRCFNVESVAELDELAAIAREQGRRAPIALRVNPDVDPRTHPYIATGLAESKFGIPMAEAEALYERAAADPWLEPRGLACHIGSQLQDVGPLLEAAERIAELYHRLEDAGVAIHHVDLGGGLGVRYTDETPPTPEEHVAAVTAPFAGTAARVLVEPGRAVVAEAGALLTRVTRLKRNGARELAVVDAGMNDYIRPALYGAAPAIEPVQPPAPGDATAQDVVGPVCESADTFASQRPLGARPGDLLAILATGAYGFAMSSQYNARPRPPEILVDGAEMHCVRRREDDADLIQGESLLPEA